MLRHMEHLIRQQESIATAVGAQDSLYKERAQDDGSFRGVKVPREHGQ